MFVVVDKKMIDFYGIEEFKVYVLSFINIVSLFFVLEIYV